MTLSVEFTGLDELLGQLDQLAAGIAGPLRQNALHTAALIVEADAKRRVPKVSGTLARSIHTEVSPDEARVGTDVVYARRIEYGFSGTDSLGRRYNQAPQPYLRPALHSNLEPMLQAMTATLQASLRGLS